MLQGKCDIVGRKLL